MSVELNTGTVSRYKDWNNLPSDVVKDNILTVNRESNRQPDPWYFLVGREGLFDVKRQRYVKNVVAEFPHPNLYLRKVENDIIESLDSWSNSGDEGVAIWFSPSYAGEYDSSKIEIIVKGYTFGDMKLATQNVCILFDASEEEVVKIAKEIFPELSNISSAEDLRKTLITKKELNIEIVLEALRPYIETVENYHPPSEEDLNYLAGLAAAGIDQRYIAAEMKRLGIIGKHSFSCDKSGGGLANAFEENSLNVDLRDDGLGPKEFPCPACGFKNKRPHGQLVHSCQNPDYCPNRSSVRC